MAMLSSRQIVSVPVPQNICAGQADAIRFYFPFYLTFTNSASNTCPYESNVCTPRSTTTLINPDRLAPQTAAAEILTDVTDCITYIRKQLTSDTHLTSSEVDVSKIAVSGSSAGGYLALLAGLHAKPSPTVILAIYPITDPWGVFFTTPQPHPDGRVGKEVVAPFLDRNAEAVAGNPPGTPRGKMYYYMLQEANLARLLDVSEADVGLRVARAMSERRGERLPPVYVVHGDADKFVGVEQADEVVQVLRDLGAVVEYERLPGLDHLFDNESNVELEGMYGFMKRYVKC